jgi:hypothetical protein
LHAEVHAQIFGRASLQSARDMIRGVCLVHVGAPHGVVLLKCHNAWYGPAPAHHNHAGLIVRMRRACSRASLLRIFFAVGLMFYQ